MYPPRHTYMSKIRNLIRALISNGHCVANVLILLGLKQIVQDAAITEEQEVMKTIIMGSYSLAKYIQHSVCFLHCGL